MTLKCEIERNIANQSLDFYIFNSTHYFVVSEENNLKQVEFRTDSFSGRMKPAFSLHYEMGDVLLKAASEFFTNIKLNDGSAVAAKTEHIKDLNRVLNHFMAKDNRKNEK